MNESASDIELIDPGEDGHSEVSVGPETNAPSTLVLVVGLVVVAALLWFLTRSNTPEEPGPDQAIIEEGVGDTPATTLIVPTSGVRPTTPTTLIPGVAVLGEPTGLWLFYGGDDRLQRVDLDDGEVSRYGLRAHPLASVQGELIVSTAAVKVIGWVSLEDPSEQAEGWKDGRIALPADGVHIQFLDEAEGVWTRLELPSGRIVETQTAFAPVPLAFRLPGRPAMLAPGPDLVSTANGIYASINPPDGGEAEYTRVRASGQILIHDPSKALVQDCGADLLDCSSAWFSRTDWSQLSLPTPDQTIGFAEILGDGTWLHTIDISGAHQLLLLEPSPEMDLEESFGIEVAIESLSISPDGRWLAVKQPDMDLIELIDLTTGITEKRFSGFSAGSSGTLLFVSKPTGP